jgi:DNA-binding transcriptional regulator YbjK
VTAAVTPKGERRRYALVSAAAELLCEGGFEAVRHRAVARRAGLPLASTTYYFSSLDDLIISAVDHIGMLEVAQLRARVASLSRRRRGAESTADVLVDLLVSDEPGPGMSAISPVPVSPRCGRFSAATCDSVPTRSPKRSSGPAARCASSWSPS